jgi:hypothetical protein
MATSRKKTKKAKTTKSRKTVTKKRAVSYKKKAAPRKKASLSRSKTTTKRTTKKSTRRFGTVRYVSKSRGKFKYVVYDGGGKDHYGTNSLRKARAMVSVLKEKHPRAKFTIYEIARGK